MPVYYILIFSYNHVQKQAKLFLLEISYQFYIQNLEFVTLVNLFIISINLLMSLLEKKTKIWKDGQTTIPFVCPQTSFSKSRRFKLYSIYWPEKNYSAGLIKQTRTPIDLQAYRISKLIDDQEKNQSRMAKMPGRKSQDKASSLSQPRNGFSKFIPTRLQSLSRKNQQIVFRLTSASQMSQSKLRDRHGNRANVYENQQQDLLFSTLKEQRKYRGAQKGFCTSRRINLNLPHNYYPGPGTYQIKRYLQQKNRLRNQMIKRQKGDNIQNDN